MKKLIVGLLALMLVCALGPPALGQTLASDWNGTSLVNGVSFYGWLGDWPNRVHSMAVVSLWDDEQPFASDAAATGTTPWLEISEWTGADGSVKWASVNDSVADLDAFTLVVQGKYWGDDANVYNLDTLVSADSIAETTHIDTLDFDDAKMLCPLIRVAAIGADSGSVYTEFDLAVRLSHRTQ